MSNKKISQLDEYTGSPSGFTIPGVTSAGTRKANLANQISQALASDTTKASKSELTQLSSQLSEFKKSIIGKETIAISQSGRVSKGIALDAGTYTIKLSIVSGENSGLWRIYGYKNGAMDSSKYSGPHSFGQSANVTVADNEDGVWIFTELTVTGSAVSYNLEIEDYPGTSVMAKVDASTALSTQTAATVSTIQTSVSSINDQMNGHVETTEATVQGNGYIQKYIDKSGTAGKIEVKISASNSGMNGSTVKLYYTTTTNIFVKDIAIGDNWQYVTIPESFTKLYLFGTTFSSYVSQKIYFSIRESVGLSEGFSELSSKFGDISQAINGTTTTISDVTVTDRISAFLGISGNANDVIYLSFYSEGTSIANAKIRVRGNFASGYEDITVLDGNAKYAKVVIPKNYTNIQIFSTDDSLVRGDKFDVKTTFVLGISDKIQIASNKPYSGKTFVVFGDSITEFLDNNTKKTWCQHFAEITGANVINLGIGGTRITPRDEYSSTLGESQAYCRLDIKNAVNAVIGKDGSQDFTRFEEGVEWLKNNRSDDNSAILERARATDLSGVDYVIIFGGTNDWYSNTGQQAADTLSDIVEALYSEYPHLRVFIFSPIPRYCDNVRDEAHWSDNVEKGGVTLKELAEDICELQSSIKVPCYNSYDLIGINQWNFGNYFSPTDGTHPYKGMELLAKRFSAFVTSVEN